MSSGSMAVVSDTHPRQSAPVAKATRSARREPASTAAVQIVQAAIKEGVSVADLSKLAACDPAFAMRVLALVNSPAFARAQTIQDVNQATALLGIRGLRNIALSLVVSDLVPMGEDGSLLLCQSLRRAITARLLAEAVNERETDTYFTAGLLLESGLLVRARDDLARAADIARMPSHFRVVHEQAMGEVPHPETGSELAQEYHLAPETVEAIRYHHADEPPAAQLARMCWLAERVAGVFESGVVSEAQQAALDAASQVGVSEQAILNLLERLPGLVTDTAAAFQREVAPQLDLQQLRDDANARLVEMNHQLEETVRTLKRLIAEKEDLAKRLQQANQALAEQAATDALTELPNRRALEEALSRDLSRAWRNGEPLSFVVADVDHFKKFNDTYGHQTGDEVLKCVARVIRAAARKGDVPARFGGEEFCVILPKADEQGAMLAARRLRIAIERTTIPSPQGPLRVTASFGIATIDANVQETKEELFKRADDALYRAKEAGRNCVMVAPPPIPRSR
jgi:diguanylate cyclase (GGDEF)-like protein